MVVRLKTPLPATSPHSTSRLAFALALRYPVLHKHDTCLQTTDKLATPLCPLVHCARPTLSLRSHSRSNTTTPQQATHHPEIPVFGLGFPKDPIVPAYTSHRQNRHPPRCYACLSASRHRVWPHVVLKVIIDCQKWTHRSVVPLCNESWSAISGVVDGARNRPR